MELNDIVQVVVSVVVTAIVTMAITYVKTVRSSVRSIKDGVLSLLRAELIRSHDKYCKKNYCPLYAKEALEKAYNAYHNLGGNGAMTRIYEEIIELPTEPK